MLNWFEKAGVPIPCVNRYQYLQHLKTMFRFGLNIVAVRMDTETWTNLQQTPAEDLRIDVWWQNDASSRLLLLFAYLMTRKTPWSQAVLRVLVPGSKFNLEQEKERAKKMLDEVRIEAEPFIVDSFDPEKVAEHSIGSSLVFLPFSFKAGPLPGAFGSATHMPASVMAIAAEDIDLDAEPEEGSVALMAEASDALDAAKAKMKKANKRAEIAREAVEKLNQKLSKMESNAADAVDPEQREELEQQVESAEKEARQAQSSAAKATAKTEKAEKRAETIVKDTTTPPSPKID